MRSLARAWITLALGALIAAGCGGLTVQPIPVTVSRYDTLAPLSLDEFVRARASFDAGDVHGARAAFERLHVRLPDNVIVGIWVQETELEAELSSGSSGAATAPPDPAAEERARAALTERWSAAAAERPTVTGYVLAARVAPTEAESKALLDKAEALDPACAWIPYARAFMAAQAADWTSAREQIARAKAADPGHVWSYWLEAWMTTRAGSVSDAAVALTAFVDRAVDDPRVQPRILAESQLDLAMLMTLLDEGKKARDLLQKVDPRYVGPARRLMAMASIEQALEDLAPALAAAEQAEKIAPGTVLPVVQQALLYEEWLEDPVKAEATWRRVLEIARASPELTSVLERTRAGVRIERFEAARAKSAREAKPAASPPDPR